MASAGVTDFGACEIAGDKEDRERTRGLLIELAQDANGPAS